MTNVAGFYALEALIGAIWAAAIIAVADFLIAAFVLLAASKSQPGSEIDFAFDVRKLAVESVQADARDLKLTIDALGEEMKNVRATIAGFVQNPLDAAAQKLLIPAALSILRGLRSKKVQP